MRMDSEMRYRSSQIIAGFAGIGKSTLAEKHPDKYIDFVAMPYKYHLDESASHDESSKANPDNRMRMDWPINYVKAIREVIQESDKVLLIPSDASVLRLLRQADMKYILCYPTRNSREVYQRRFIERGNTEEFLNVFIDGWDYFMDHLENDQYGFHVIMQPGQFIEDVIDRRAKEELSL